MGISGAIAFGAFAGAANASVNGTNPWSGALTGGLMGAAGGELFSGAGMAGGTGADAATQAAGENAVAGGAGQAAQQAAQQAAGQVATGTLDSGLSAAASGAAPSAIDPAILSNSLPGSGVSGFASDPGLVADAGNYAGAFGPSASASPSYSLPGDMTGSATATGTMPGAAPGGGLQQYAKNMVMTNGQIDPLKAIKLAQTVMSMTGKTPNQLAQQASQNGAQYLTPSQRQSLNAKGPGIAQNPFANNVIFQPTKYARGGRVSPLQAATNPGPGGYLDGPTMGQADQVPIQAAHGEFVLPADVVSHLGDGNNKAGALRLHAMMDKVRRHKKAPRGLPPPVGPLSKYLKGA